MAMIIRRPLCLILKQPGLLLELVSLPQSQTVELLYCHTKHLNKLLRGKVTLREQKRVTETIHLK